MKNLELRSALIKSGIILILCIFLIYSFAVEDSGGMTGTLASLFSALSFLIGITLAVTISILMMFGIYFGILYMYDQETCKKTYGEFTTKLQEISKTVASSCSCKCRPAKITLPPLTDDDLKPLRSSNGRLDSQLTALQSSVAALEKTVSTVSSSVVMTAGEIARLDTRANDVDETLNGKATTDLIDEASKKLANDITALQNSIKPLAAKILELESTLAPLAGKGKASEGGSKENVAEDIGEIKDELATMKKVIQALSPQAPETTNTTEDASHRILSYFDDKTDEEMFITRVSEAVDKEMTYAEVGAFLEEKLSTEASTIIAKHPSLTKDYIRTCRQKH